MHYEDSVKMSSTSHVGNAIHTVPATIVQHTSRPLKAVAFKNSRPINILDPQSINILDYIRGDEKPDMVAVNI